MYSCRLFYDSSRHRLRHRQLPRNTNSWQHWPWPTMRRLVSHSTDGRASLSHRADDRRTRYGFFDFWRWRAYCWVKGHQNGRLSTIHLDLPSYKISARSHKGCTRYALPKFFTFGGDFDHSRSSKVKFDGANGKPVGLMIKCSGVPTSYLSPFSRYFESKFWLLTFWPWLG